MSEARDLRRLKREQKQGMTDEPTHSSARERVYVGDAETGDVYRQPADEYSVPTDMAMDRTEHVPSVLSARSYYNEYHGHRVPHLVAVFAALKRYDAPRDTPIIWTAGDSSLDNKYWFGQTGDALEAYGQVLDPPTQVKDVAYWVNRRSIERGSRYRAINTAVEATTLNERSCGRLLPQDRFLRDNVGPEDIVVVSVGGNDIAMAPAPCTICNILCLICCVPSCCIETGRGCCKPACPLPCDDPCCGCCCSCASDLGACPPCAGYFLHLYK